MAVLTSVLVKDDPLKANIQLVLNIDNFNFYTFNAWHVYLCSNYLSAISMG